MSCFCYYSSIVYRILEVLHRIILLREPAMEYSKNQHSVYNMTYHAVFVTKYRRPVMTEEMREAAKERAAYLLKLYKGGLVEMNGEPDHLHILFSVPPSKAPSMVVCSLKTQLSKLFKAEYPEQVKRYLWKDAFWSASYFISTTGGASIETLEAYIRDQGTEHHKRKYVKSGKFQKKRKRADSSPTD